MAAPGGEHVYATVRLTTRLSRSHLAYPKQNVLTCALFANSFFLATRIFQVRRVRSIGID